MIKISGRRFVWGISCLLLLATALIFRPVRTWIDQIVVARCLHPNLNVHELRLHRSSNLRDHTIVQASHFDWGATDDSRCFGITAESAWFVVKDESLLAKTVSIPQAVLKNSRLFMETLSDGDHLASLSRDAVIESSDIDSIWQHHLDSKHGQWNWNELKKFLDSTLQTDSIASECTSRIDSWIARGAELANVAEGLTDSQIDWSNPLRDPEDIKRRLGQIEELVKKQDDLRSELKSVEQFIDSKLQFIGTVFDQQRAELKVDDTNPDAAATPDVHLGEAEVDIKSVASELLERSGSQAYSRFGVFMELADRFCRAVLRDPRPHYDRDFRQSGQELVSLQQLTATGMFRCDPVLVPFRMSTNGIQIQKQGADTTSQVCFHYQFEVNPVRLLVMAKNHEDSQTSNELQMELLPLASSYPSTASDPQPPMELKTPQWRIVSDGTQISGHLELDERLIPVLLSDHPAMVQAALEDRVRSSDDAHEVIRLNFSGSWNSVRWKVSDSELPFWFLKEIMLEQQRQMHERNQKQIACVEQYFHGEIERLDSILQLAMDLALDQSRKQSDTVLAARALLNNELGKVQQIEFARQPKEEVKR